MIFFCNIGNLRVQETFNNLTNPKNLLTLIIILILLASWHIPTISPIHKISGLIILILLASWHVEASEGSNWWEPFSATRRRLPAFSEASSFGQTGRVRVVDATTVQRTKTTANVKRDSLHNSYTAKSTGQISYTGRCYAKQILNWILPIGTTSWII